jgi:mannose-6-phosphate isomerase-like protein (cupin superfamily)
VTEFKSAIILVSILALPICVASASAHDEEPNRDKDKIHQGYVLKPGEGEDTIGDGSSLIKASPKTGTQGAVFVEDKMPPSSTSGIHVHYEADEFFYVLEGSGRIRLGTDEYEIGPGDTVFVPVGTDHKITSGDEKPLHVIFIVDRPGLDEQFRAEFQGLDRTKMTIAEFNEIVVQYGTVYKTFD